MDQKAQMSKMVLLVVAVLASLSMSAVEAQLVPNFYRKTCPNAENVITSAITTAINKDKGNAPGLLRMHFHDCFVRGCDGSVLIDSPSEKDAIPNLSLRGFDAIDSAKAAVEKICPGVVSCADILALASQISVKMASGGRITWKVPTGRRDGLVSSPTEPLSNLPGPNFDVAQLTTFFAAKGLSQAQMVALSGAHSIGHAGCATFSSRLPNGTAEAPIDPAYAKYLQAQCPTGSTNNVNLDVTTPTRLDEIYYKNLQHNRGLLKSDQVLQYDPATQPMVAANANIKSFIDNFRSAMIAMGEIGVLTGSQGQIRLNCRRFN